MSALSESLEFLDDRELARRTPISRVQFQVWRARGGGPPYRKIGRRCIYLWSEVVAWIDSQRIDPAKGGAR